MSLKAFLAVGRSFAGSGPDRSPYHMRKGHLLPTFQGKPRFVKANAAAGSELVQEDWLETPTTGRSISEGRAGGQADGTREQAGSTGQDTAVAVRIHWQESTTGNAESSTVAESAVPLPAGRLEPAVVRPLPLDRQPVQRRSWKERLFRFLGFGLARVEARRDMVQGELSLDRVRVVRNDLTESDLELVAVQRERQRHARRSIGNPKPKPAWSDLASRLFAVGRGSRSKAE